MEMGIDRTGKTNSGFNQQLFGVKENKPDEKSLQGKKKEETSRTMSGYNPKTLERTKPDESRLPSGTDQTETKNFHSSSDEMQYDFPIIDYYDLSKNPNRNDNTVRLHPIHSHDYVEDKSDEANEEENVVQVQDNDGVVGDGHVNQPQVPIQDLIDEEQLFKRAKDVQAESVAAFADETFIEDFIYDFAANNGYETDGDLMNYVEEVLERYGNNH
jgi:hypothetical protein